MTDRSIARAGWFISLSNAGQCILTGEEARENSDDLPKGYPGEHSVCLPPISLPLNESEIFYDSTDAVLDDRFWLAWKIEKRIEGFLFE